jgi:hypothetical protein
MKTQILNQEEPYAELLCSHVKKEFPQVVKLTTFELMDVLANTLIGTKEIRYGSLPIPESSVTIRTAIRAAIENNLPIPVLVPWGSIKADFSATLDIAELTAIQRLINLAKITKEYYSNGLEIVIRVEDTSGYTLFTLEENLEKIKENINLYSSDMKRLVQILSKDGQEISVQLESEMDNAFQFNTIFNTHLSLIEQYLFESWDNVKEYPINTSKMDSYKLLSSLGWKGIISWEQRMHYIEAYERIYPNWKLETHIKRLALYFTGAWTRSLLGMTGKQKHWDKFVQLSFTPPIKGVPEGYNYNYVYHRTLPLSEARTHISPWRAKGYLKINGNEIHHKVTSFNDKDTNERLTPIKMEIYNEEQNLSVIINTDYLLES